MRPPKRLIPKPNLKHSDRFIKPSLSFLNAMKATIIEADKIINDTTC